MKKISSVIVLLITFICIIAHSYAENVQNSKPKVFKIIDEVRDEPSTLELVPLMNKVSSVYPLIQHPSHQIEFLKILWQHSNEMKQHDETKLSFQSTLLKVQQESPFDCESFPPSPQVPTSVDRLLPGDIRVIAAMGDSLTAGFGAMATSYWDIFTEYRGVSWSIGGDNSVQDGIFTVPNFLRNYNPNINGFSLLTGRSTSVNSHLNRAVTGSKAPDVVNQAYDLVQKMKQDKSINITEDWKMITIWVGSNDLCAVCKEPSMYSPEAYESNIRKAISHIKQELPRTFINLIQGINPTELNELKGGWCSWLHSYECPCGSSSDSGVRDDVTKTLREYNQRLIKIANDTAFIADDFSVIIQPFLSFTDIPKDSSGSPDMKYFALDCFHFSGVAHQAAAIGLWNNLFQKVNHKTIKFTPGEPIICPTRGQYLATVKNSV